jgi:hypothetical protein
MDIRPASSQSMSAQRFSQVGELPGTTVGEVVDADS